MFYDDETKEQLRECKWIIVVVLILFVVAIVVRFYYPDGPPRKAERICMMPESYTDSSDGGS